MIEITKINVCIQQTVGWAVNIRNLCFSESVMISVVVTGYFTSAWVYVCVECAV